MSEFKVYLDSLSNLGISPSLEGIRRLVKEIGDPQNSFDAVQITGTNGKTSTARFLSNILRHHSLRCGLYLSPHLQDYNERWSVDGNEISDGRLEELGAELIGYVKKANAAMGGRKLTQFEVLTGFAFYYFMKEKIDVAVVEVGMGGRWDATSVVKPDVAIFTSVTIDHADFLGDTVEKIAAEKSHVIKENTAAITGYVEDSVREILTERAARQGGSIYFLGRDFDVEDDGKGGVDIRGTNANYEGLYLPLAGEYQRRNLAVAVVAAERYLDRSLDREGLELAIADMSAPGRLELVSKNPRVLLDGAHNAAGAAELRASLEEEFAYHRLIVIISILKDKEVEAFLDTILTLADTVIVTTNDNSRALSETELFQLAKDRAINVRSAISIKAALDTAAEMAGEDDLICVTGSLYGVGEARGLYSDIG